MYKHLSSKLWEEGWTLRLGMIHQVSNSYLGTSCIQFINLAMYTYYKASVTIAGEVFGSSWLKLSRPFLHCMYLYSLRMLIDREYTMRNVFAKFVAATDTRSILETNKSNDRTFHGDISEHPEKNIVEPSDKR